MSVSAYAAGAQIPGLLVEEGDGVDLYTGTKETVKYNDFSTIFRNNAVFSLSNLAGGASSVYLSPFNGGLGTIGLTIELPVQAGVPTAAWSVGAALNKGWGFQAIDYVQFRYSNSDVYQLTGRQIMLQAIKTATDTYVAEKMMELAGNALFTPSGGVNPFLVSNYAYVPICLPHCGAQGGNTPLPLRMDQLSAPVQIIVNLKPLSQILDGATASSAPAYAALQFQIKQIMPSEGMVLPKVAKPLPCVFQQQENQIDILPTQTGAKVAVQLVGFRNGSIKCLDVYAVEKNQAVSSAFVFKLAKDVDLDFMGNRLYSAPGFSSQFWNLTYSKHLTGFPTGTIVASTGATTAVRSSWLQIPFTGIETELRADHMMSSSGLAISNGQLTLSLNLPTSANGYTLYYSADIECALEYRDGSVSYVF